MGRRAPGRNARAAPVADDVTLALEGGALHYAGQAEEIDVPSSAARGAKASGPTLRARLEAAFHLSFRRNPFHGGFTIACGLEYAIDWIESLGFDEDDLAYLAELRGSDDTPLFDRAFLDYLGALRFSCDVDAVPEGTAVFPLEPMARVTGPILQAQLVETALLNAINFQSLVATKAARVVMAARGDPVLEFGLRRAQGFDGGLSASRAA